jgi:hypothetical protein
MEQMNDAEAGFKPLGTSLPGRIMRIGALVFVVLLVLTSIDFAGGSWPRLFIGWASFLPKALPRIGISWGGIARFAGILLLIALLAHRLCSWLWRESGHREAWRPRWTLTAVGGIVVMFAAGMAFTGIAHQTAWLMVAPRPRDELGGGNSAHAWGSLSMIANAQEKFRYDDSDGNGKPDYWRADVAGLYAVKPGKIAWLELSVALADDRARTDLSPYSKGVALPAAESGYYFRALRFEDEADDRRRRDGYAVCTFPSSLSAGASMFIVSNQRIYYGRRFEGKAPEYYPTDPERDGWIPIDK